METFRIQMEFRWKMNKFWMTFLVVSARIMIVTTHTHIHTDLTVQCPFEWFVRKDFQSFTDFGHLIFRYRFFIASIRRIVIDFMSFVQCTHKCAADWCENIDSSNFSINKLNARAFSLTKFKLSSFIKCFMFWEYVLVSPIFIATHFSCIRIDYSLELGISFVRILHNDNYFGIILPM